MRRGSRSMEKECRGSEFIGVSKNGRKWQAILILGKEKIYIGTSVAPEEAARKYDKFALVYRGL